MKKIAFCIMALCMSLAFFPLQTNAAVSSEPNALVVPKAADAAKVKTLEVRLNQIKEMDKSDMSSADKKVLRKEVRSIKQQLSDLGGGVYLSAGAIIVVLLLLIILL